MDLKIKGAVGLDLSITSTGFCKMPMDGQDAISHSFGTDSKYGCMASRQDEILVFLEDRIGEKDVLFIENSSFGSRNSIFILAELGGVVKHWAWLGNKPVILVAPTTVKKWAKGEGKGSIKKDQMRLAVYKKYGKEFKTDDEVDAFVLADIGIHFLHELGVYVPQNLFRVLKKYEEECLDTLLNRKKKSVNKENAYNIGFLKNYLEISNKNTGHML